MGMDNLNEFSDISIKGAEQTIETSHLTFASILSMKMNQTKTRLEKINGKMDERIPSLFRYDENFFVACKQS